MNKRKLAKNNEEFDRRFDQGEDIHNLIDVSKAAIMKPGKKVRITSWVRHVQGFQKKS